MSNKIDITSTALEKGIDIAKSFLEKLVFPAVEETGLLLKDKITFWKFKNQVKMLNKAQAFCQKNNIQPKNIPLKLISPMLDYSALEEDEKLQDKWAILLSNMVDSDQNIENHVFPYILSQISINELDTIESIFNEKSQERINAVKELELLKPKNEELTKENKQKIESLKKEVESIKGKKGRGFSSESWNLEKQIREIESQITKYRHDEFHLFLKSRESAEIPEGYLEEFELSNLIRLGLLKESNEISTDTHNLEIPIGDANEYGYLYYDLDIEMESKTSILVTELGELFIKACTEKMKKS